jgi:hypothetical protein
VDTVVADTSRAALLVVAGDAVTDLAEAGQLPLLRRSLRLDVDVDQVSRSLPLVTLNRRYGLKISQPPEPKAVERPRHGGERSGQQPGDMA